MQSDKARFQTVSRNNLFKLLRCQFRLPLIFLVLKMVRLKKLLIPLTNLLPSVPLFVSGDDPVDDLQQLLVGLQGSFVNIERKR